MGLMAIASIGAPAPAAAAKLCNTVVDRDGEPVVDRDTDVVVHEGTFECPPEPVAAAPTPAPPPVEPAAPPPTPVGNIEVGTVYFDFDSAQLDFEEAGKLDGIIAEVEELQPNGVLLAGHADTAGSPEYNLELSERRARNVASALVARGFPATIDVQQEALGETDLAVQTPDGTPEELNRRVTLTTQG